MVSNNQVHAIGARRWITAALVQQRKAEGGKKAGRGRPQQVEQYSAQPKRVPQARDEVAAEAKTSRYKAEQALRIVQDAPEEATAVIAGKQSLREAVKKVRATTAPRSPRQEDGYLDAKTKLVSRIRKAMLKYPQKRADLKAAITRAMEAEHSAQACA
jgi:hypothetical protein